MEKLKQDDTTLLKKWGVLRFFKPDEDVMWEAKSAPPTVVEVTSWLLATLLGVGLFVGLLFLPARQAGRHLFVEVYADQPVLGGMLAVVVLAIGVGLLLPLLAWSSGYALTDRRLIRVRWSLASRLHTIEPVNLAAVQHTALQHLRPDGSGTLVITYQRQVVKLKRGSKVWQPQTDVLRWKRVAQAEQAYRLLEDAWVASGDHKEQAWRS